MKTLSNLQRAILKAVIILSCLFFVAVATGQEGKAEYKIVGNEIVKVADSTKTATATKTALTYKVKNTVYPVYKGSKGGYYIIRTSKKGNKYKQYFKLNN